ncbi:MAG: squalene--hopene cyclase [Pirellulales bacterium]|nr:squalene--hopene cyclase [Pirellulales bacterium]
MPTAQQIRDSLFKVRQELLAARSCKGYWEGRLASSALSTATAVSALAILEEKSNAKGENSQKRRQAIQAGLSWMAKQQNADGGFGDTDLSHSNIATSMLIAAAVRLAGAEEDYHGLLNKCETYISRQGGITALRARYGKDKTFAVPILTNCALAGITDWREVSPLPFELAVLPQGFFRFMRLPVVSYAIPALVAIGQAKYFHDKPRNPLTRGLRAAAAGRSLRVLKQMQPESGGFLEATPLTAFVTMSLASIGQANHAVALQGEEFLLASMRDDGSWPIDTNLATWNTTLALNALLEDTEVERPDEGQPHAHDEIMQPRLLEWLLDCQHRVIHPYTGAAPGGWAWTDLSGGVPDVDDTSGALLALARWFSRARNGQQFASRDKQRLIDAARHGIDWLIKIQNRDGGWPTFCRGWGTMPFDRSSTDLTAHSIRAMHAWKPILDQSSGLSSGIDRATRRGLHFLATSQRTDGSWMPLWFGNQHHPAEENPVYGTAKVLLAFAQLGLGDRSEAVQGRAWLRKVQNTDGGWGGDGQQSSVEETALAVEALSGFNLESAESDVAKLGLSKAEKTAWHRGLDWLVTAIRENCHRKPSPIGFYFAKLWYYEELYPLIFTTAALQTASRSRSAFPTEQSAARSPVAVTTS